MTSSPSIPLFLLLLSLGTHITTTTTTTTTTMATTSSLLNDPTVVLVVVATVACLVAGGVALSLGRKEEKMTKPIQQNAKAGKQPASSGKAAPEKSTAKTAQSTTPSSSLSQSSNTTTSSLTNENTNPVDVWAERRQRGIVPASMDRKGGTETDKPFGSSYYYAHNNPNTTGGYKDGLRMEDYAMNGPRLLSKGGKPVTDEVEASTSTSTTTTAATKESVEQARATAKTETESSSVSTPKKKRALPITQYLWDDEGGKTATIIIEKLPGGLRSTDAPVAWSAAPVKQVQTTLVDQGLRVEVESALDWDYVLHVDRLFASVTAVQAIVKPNRLRVKLTKKSTSRIMSSYDKWPHPHKKKV
eukprot:scaffold34915_cov180-Amphora_coffeaeformis.AAC.19